MSTLYELFKVPEDATQEEITQAYHQILQKADSLPQTEKLIEQVRRIKIAYEILSNPEKRKKYDLDLATKRADELLENVQVKTEETELPKLEEPSEKSSPQVYKKRPQIDEAKMKKIISDQINYITKHYSDQTNPKQSDMSSKQQRKQLRKEKRNVKKEQELKREMEIQAYGKFLENQGYRVKYPWTWPRVKRLIIAIISVTITFFILWHVPFVKNALMNLYQENFVIKFFVDIVASLFKAIVDSIKSIFQ